MRCTGKAWATKWAEILTCTTACAVLLFGCAWENHEAPQKKQETERTVLRLVVDSKAPENTKEMAKELIRRAEFYSEGELSIKISYSEDVVQAMREKETDLCLVENSSLYQVLPELKILNLPYTFKDAQYMTSAMNSQKAKARLDKIIGAKYPMKVECTALAGYVDMVASAALDLNDFMRTYTIGSAEDVFGEEVHKLLNTKWVQVPWEQGVEKVLDGESDLAETTLSKMILAAQRGNAENIIALDTGHRQQMIYLLSNTNSKKSLTKKQKAAIEQAAILSAGYSRTLAENEHKQQMDKLTELGVAWFDPNREKYFSMLGEVYQYQEEQINGEFDVNLARIIRNDAVKNVVPDAQ